MMNIEPIAKKATCTLLSQSERLDASRPEAEGREGPEHIGRMD